MYRGIASHPFFAVGAIAFVHMYLIELGRETSTSMFLQYLGSGLMDGLTSEIAI